jgi:hypothetical protein
VIKTTDINFRSGKKIFAFRNKRFLPLYTNMKKIMTVAEKEKKSVNKELLLCFFDIYALTLSLFFVSFNKKK